MGEKKPINYYGSFQTRFDALRETLMVRFLFHCTGSTDSADGHVPVSKDSVQAFDRASLLLQRG